MKQLADLTRWNRAGLSRFRYLDGNAAVWLEELRIGMLTQYLRGIPVEERLPDKWRDLFLKEKSDWPLTLTETDFAEAVAWSALLPTPPDRPENAARRNQRLREQYEQRSGEYAWEIMVAFARAAHVLLGHLDAYANEGYLRTATQWENLRKLAAMVNYVPAPPASAVTTVALEIAEGVGTIEIAAGLATKYTRREGGAPLIFETLRPLLAHPDLNRVRASGWDRNGSPIDITRPSIWKKPRKARLAQGDLAVLAGGTSAGTPLTIVTVEELEGAELAQVTFDPPARVDLSLADAGLYSDPEGVRLGLPETTSAQVVVQVVGAASIPANSVVEIRHSGGTSQAIVAESSGSQLVLTGLPEDIAGTVEVEAYTPIAETELGFQTPEAVQTLFFKQRAGTGVLPGEEGERDPPVSGIRTYRRPAEATGMGYARLGSNRTFNGIVVRPPSWPSGTPGRSVRFEGKPPDKLKQGDWYIARPLGSGELSALQVASLRVEAEVYHVVFASAPPAAPERTEFFGPMTQRLQPLHHDRNPEPAISDGAAFLTGFSPEARRLVKAGKTALVVLERDGAERQAGQARIAEVEDLGEELKVTLVSDSDFSGWEKGWTTFHLNSVDLSHGESKDPKVLGSGDAERRQQEFTFNVKGVSFIPSTLSARGVQPDMDVAVDGEIWPYRDLSDPEAEGISAWSARLNEDDTLQIVFRRRLPTGKNNVTVPRYRIGVGLAGTNIPPWSFTEPMKKNRFVTGILQPFPTAGGAEREPVSAMRRNAPAKLAANGRAVSLKDFERLCAGHSGVWQARARQIIRAGRTNHVDIVIVPAGGGAVTGAFKENLVTFILGRSPPGASVTISLYEAVPVSVSVTLRVERARFEASAVQEAVQTALAEEFSLSRRRLGQPLYVAEILAAAEAVPGVENLVINHFARKPGFPGPLREAEMAGALAAIFPREEQVVQVEDRRDILVQVEAV